MSLIYVSPKRPGRVYVRKFDHDEARRLRAEEFLSYAAIAERLGVSERAVSRVCDPDMRRKMAKHSARFGMSGECKRCGGPCALYNPNGICRGCSSEAKQTRFRFDELGSLAAIRCVTCKTWKDADLFPSDRAAARSKHEQCRECGSKTRRAYRERHKVPCIGCGKRVLPPSEKGAKGSPFARCVDCLYEWMRLPAQREAARKRSLAALDNGAERSPSAERAEPELTQASAGRSSGEAAQTRKGSVI